MDGKFIFIDEVRRRLDRDAVFYKLLLYATFEKKHHVVPSEVWDKVDPIGPKVNSSDARDYLRQSLTSEDYLRASINFQFIGSNTGSGYLVGTVDHVLRAMKQRDLGHQAVDIFDSYLHGYVYLSDYLGKSPQDLDSPAFQDLEALSEDFRDVYDLYGLLIKPKFSEIEDIESHRSQMGSDVEFFDSRMKPTSNRND